MPTPLSLVRRAYRSIRFGSKGSRDVFQYIFRSRYWGDSESLSGIGSSLAETEMIRTELPRLVERFRIRSMIDAPCGDLYWMAPILDVMKIDYIGGDIVPEIVEIAAGRSTYERARFMVFDIMETPFPKVDLWLCRDVLFHLSFSNIRKALRNFLESEIEYLLVTSHTSDHVPNRPIVTGDFRQLNIFKPPLNFPAGKVLHRFDDFAPGSPYREMVLFRRTDLKASGCFG